jgi:hypothetical protein
LHSKANPEVRNFSLAGVANRDQHPFNAPLAKTARNQNSVVTFKLRIVAAVLIADFQSLGLNPVQLELEIMRKRAVD